MEQNKTLESMLQTRLRACILASLIALGVADYVTLFGFDGHNYKEFLVLGILATILASAWLYVILLFRRIRRGRYGDDSVEVRELLSFVRHELPKQTYRGTHLTVLGTAIMLGQLFVVLPAALELRLDIPLSTTLGLPFNKMIMIGIVMSVTGGFLTRAT